jgi:hypothetical protein
MHDDDLVSVIIPAYNAASTLGETLDSVRRQTHRRLEVIVVDDGSQDRTAEIAEAHAAEDGRIRLIRKENGGVARARNAGATASRADYLAPVDADDLWHPEKIARQLAALRAAGPEAGYAYTYCRHIDGASRVIQDAGGRTEGAAFLRSVLGNFVGNGSSLLIRRVAFDSVGGYDPSLRDAGLQGCEDYLLQMLIARHWRIVCVPAYLTGYRRAEGTMSDDRLRMTRSQCAAFDMVARRVPEAPADILNATRAKTLARTGMRLGPRRKREALGLLRAAFAAEAHTATWVIARETWRILKSQFARLGPKPADAQPHFIDLAPDQPLHAPKPATRVRRTATLPVRRISRLIRPSGMKCMAALAARDEEFFVPAPPPIVPLAGYRHERLA